MALSQESFKLRLCADTEELVAQVEQLRTSLAPAKLVEVCGEDMHKLARALVFSTPEIKYGTDGEFVATFKVSLGGHSKQFLTTLSVLSRLT